MGKPAHGSKHGIPHNGAVSQPSQCMLKSWTAEIAQNPGTKTFGSIQAVLLFPYDVTATGLITVDLRSHLKQLVVIGWSLA